MSNPTPIRFGNLREWIAQTRRLDDHLYRPSARAEASRGSWMPRVRRPLFVIGAPRSGTSFLGDACGALPEFSYHYEPPITKAASRYIHERRWPRPLGQLFYRAIYGWLVARHRDGDLRFAEKTPQNCFIVPFLAETFRDAQFVHIVRDGRDCALSYAEKKWLTTAGAATKKRESGGYKFGPEPRYWVETERRDEFRETSDLHRCIWAWRRHVETALGATATLPSERLFTLRYESLVRDPTDVGDELLDFLDITSGASRERLLDRLRNANVQSVGRWQAELDAAGERTIEQEAGPLLEQLGYHAEVTP